MKQFPITLALAALFASVLTGCKVYSYEERGSRNIEPQHNVATVPIVADVEILSQEKITYTEKFNDVVLKSLGLKNRYTYAKRDGSVTGNEVVEACKYVAQAHALRQYGADFFIAVIFDVNYIQKDETLEVTLTGYPAKYSGLRKATSEDSWFINTNNR